MWEYKQEYTQNVCWINKWKWQFEPQIWNCVTCNRHHWQTFSTSCVLSPIGGCWVILAVHMGPRHALLASSSFFIIFEYHCNLRVGTWQASPTLSPCSMHLKSGPVSPVNAKRQPSELACLSGSQALSFLLSATPTLFWYLKQFSTWNRDSSYTHTSSLSLSILSLFSHNPPNRFIKLEMARNWGENERISLDTITNFLC